MPGKLFVRKVILLLTWVLLCVSFMRAENVSNRFFSPADHLIRYTGRFDFTNPRLPRAWAPGVYIEVGFTSPYCEIVLHDEELYGKFHNYIIVVIDGGEAKRMKLDGKVNRIKVAENLPGKKHRLLVCKGTEANIGYLEFAGIYCQGLWQLPAKPVRKIEFVGNSITCGTGSDTSLVRCGQGEWYDQHNAWMAYGPLTARALKSQWHLSSYSGIGLVKSCCDLKMVMPDVFDKVNMRDNVISWDFRKYQPDVLTVCLGQNDGILDSALFCSRYVSFIQSLRKYYPGATLVCLTSPMADEKLAASQKKYLTAIVQVLAKSGDRQVYSYFFSKRYHKGCGDHPDLREHQEIAAELTGFVRKIKGW